MPPNNQQPAAQFPIPAQPAGPAPVDQQFQPPVQPVGSSVPPQGKTSAPQQPQRKANTTQNSLLLSELREGMVIMADGSFRAVIACKSINFDLMSAREREAVEYSYQNFLNALYFPVQIFIRSQRVDIGPYLDREHQLS